jgi:3-keto-disaccharide hydrolase
MTGHRWPVGAGIGVLAGLVVAVSGPGAQERTWPIHSLDRPRPPVVDPGPVSPTPAPPSDAVVLFGGRSLEAWQSADTSHGLRAAPWTASGGILVVAPGRGDIQTRRGFGDVQLHVEWRAPVPAHGEGQERGNSGVFLMGLYEVQVLDSWHNVTYADGQAAAAYGQFPPLVNASRPPGQWQAYDIVFHRPRFAPDGHVLEPARLTVLHNGVLVQDDVRLTGPTAHGARPPYVAHPDRLPLKLQDHGNRVAYRNIWIRELAEPRP